MKKKDLWVYMIITIMAGLISSCHLSDIELGENLLPPEDNVFLFRDTIFEISGCPVTGKHVLSSETSFDVDRIVLMGKMKDTITGSSKASIVTQFNSNPGFKSGPNMEIDSLLLFLYIKDYLGDMDHEITIRVHEFIKRIYMDSAYYSDFDPTGKINPVPLVEKSFVPENASTVEFLIEDQDFLGKFLTLGNDASLVSSDSVFKDFFNGLYIEAESTSPDGIMARVELANTRSLLSLKYANDSTEIDSTAGVDYKWSHFTIDQFFSQKINLFEHDHSGTHLSSIIDNENANSQYFYVQGMAGVNTRLSFTSLDEWIEKTPIAISSASLVFDVVPETESGIRYDDLPIRLMLGTIMEDETTEPVYDYFVLVNNQHSDDFGGYLKAESDGLFFDTTYTYRFNMELHFQSMIDGAKDNTDFILQLDDRKVSSKISKLWSNLHNQYKTYKVRNCVP